MKRWLARFIRSAIGQRRSLAVAAASGRRSLLLKSGGQRLPLQNQTRPTYDVTYRIGAGVALIALLAILPSTQAQSRPAIAASPEAASSDAARAKIERYLRERFSIPPSATITVGPLRPSIYPGFLKTTVAMDLGKNKSSQDFYVTQDGNYLIAGNVYGLNGSPEQQVEQMIDMQNQPSTGPAGAPVTIVEYADLECPHCAEMQEFLEKQVLPKYGSKVRIIFKEYPLYTIHPWAVVAAVANECAFQANPADFLPFRSLIFQNQNAIKPETVRQQLLDLGGQAGLDKDKLAACLDSKATLPRVRADYVEGTGLGVNETPTFFINGKLAAGAVTPPDFFKLVDDALAQAAAK
ncbi:MAG TPA: thioredoxin domain-containing protein [Terriglobia bacterium]|nr:thioredoxin domain-containing protein [Terriglobia bacterium]